MILEDISKSTYRKEYRRHLHTVFHSAIRALGLKTVKQLTGQQEESKVLLTRGLLMPYWEQALCSLRLPGFLIIPHRQSKDCHLSSCVAENISHLPEAGLCGRDLFLGMQQSGFDHVCAIKNGVVLCILWVSAHHWILDFSSLTLKSLISPLHQPSVISSQPKNPLVSCPVISKANTNKGLDD